MKSILTMGNVPLQLIDKTKGSMSNRINCAGETLKSNAINGTKSYAIIGGTALAVDTFAGNKKVAKALTKTTKSVAKNFADTIRKQCVFSKQQIDSLLEDKGYKDKESYTTSELYDVCKELNEKFLLKVYNILNGTNDENN